ncbi:MAG TPA: hypothetical protein VFX64_02665 [Candidatus Nitrosotalea sp.]|nr:hypothetical protein [Candidatus Nitrosotalea sp.]
MHIFSIKSKLIVTILLFFVPAIAYADDGRANTAVTLGWVAIGSGIVANLSLAVFKLARRRPVAKLVGGYESTSGLAPFYKPVLDLHIMLNSIGFFAGMMHGMILVRGLDYVSLSLAIVMTFSMASGIVLKYASERNLKIFGRLAHGQFILAVLLIVLVFLHVFIMQGSFD